MNDYYNSFKADVDSIAESLDIKGQLEKAQIKLTDRLAPPPPVIQIDDGTMAPITIFTKGNISVIKGRAKVRKGYAVAMMAAAAVSSLPVYSKFISRTDDLVVYFDTEQSSFYVQQAVYRVHQMSSGDGFNKRFYAFSLRPYNPQERLEMIEYVFSKFKGLGLVVIDGIRDLIKDINSPDESTMISSKLLKWSENTGAHILTVLHENPSDGKLRGHIGTELMNKAETILRVEKMEDDKSVSKLSCEMVRGLDFEPIYFTVNDNIPEIVTNYSSKFNVME